MLLFQTLKTLLSMLYPFSFLIYSIVSLLVFIAQRPIFNLVVIELIGWIITHIFFMSLMALIIPRIKCILRLSSTIVFHGSYTFQGL